MKLTQWTQADRWLRIDMPLWTAETAEPEIDNQPNLSMNADDTPQIIALLENHVADLTSQLEKADQTWY